jgi:hypothetical protein
MIVLPLTPEHAACRPRSEREVAEAPSFDAHPARALRSATPTTTAPASGGEITWPKPSGRVQRIENPPVDRQMTVRESGNRTRCPFYRP